MPEIPDILKSLIAIDVLSNPLEGIPLFLARIACNAKDWGRAEALVRSLIADHPNEAAFADNLGKILEAKKSP